MRQSLQVPKTKGQLRVCAPHIFIRQPSNSILRHFHEYLGWVTSHSIWQATSNFDISQPRYSWSYGVARNQSFNGNGTYKTSKGTRRLDRNSRQVSKLSGWIRWLGKRSPICRRGVAPCDFLRRALRFFSWLLNLSKKIDRFFDVYNFFL